MKRYFAKPGTWFDVGTEAKLIELLYEHGETFDENGVRVPGSPDKDWAALFSGVKDGKPDEEVCSLFEFEVRE